MAGKVLVTYASRGGATAGVAEAIGQKLADCGLDVDVRPMQEALDLAPYSAVVAGSAIQGGAWLPEAVQFVQENRAALNEKRCALFLVCMTLAMPSAEKHRQFVSAWMEPVRKLVRPVSEGLFAGAFDLQKVPSFADRLKFRVSILAGVWPTGDQRDWQTIDAWAASLPPLLGV